MCNIHPDVKDGHDLRSQLPAAHSSGTNICRLRLAMNQGGTAVPLELQNTIASVQNLKIVFKKDLANKLCNYFAIVQVAYICW